LHARQGRPDRVSARLAALVAPTFTVTVGPDQAPPSLLAKVPRFTGRSANVLSSHEFR